MPRPHNPGEGILTGGGSAPPAAAQGPSISPDLYVAALSAITQVYVDVGTIKGRVTALAIDSIVMQPASQQRLSPPVAAAIHGYLHTTPAAAVVSQSADLATRLFAYLKARPTAGSSGPTTVSSGSAMTPSTAPRTVTSARDGGNGSGSGSDTGSSPQLTGQQAVAAATAVNQVAPINDPPLEQDLIGELPNLLLSFGIDSLIEDAGKAATGEFGKMVISDLDDTIIAVLPPSQSDAPDLSSIPAPPDDSDLDLPDQKASQDDGGDGGDDGGEGEGEGDGGDDGGDDTEPA